MLLRVKYSQTNDFRIVWQLELPTLSEVATGIDEVLIEPFAVALEGGEKSPKVG